jgi:CheY-like chemotaxis protein
MMNKTKNVMIVDDDSVVHYLSDKALSAFSWITKKYSAFNGKEAIHILEDYCRGLITLPDLILLDLHMPVMDGFQFIEAFQNMECMKNSPVVIAVFSSSESPHEKERLHSLGINHVIPKPVSIEKLNQLFEREFHKVCL